MGLLKGLQDLAASARTAPDVTALAAIDSEADSIFSRTMAEAAQNNLDPSAMMAFNMAFSHVREVVASRRGALSA
jgi:vacuolar-type H+-ATPase subunit H